MKNRWLPFLALLVLGALAYANSFRAPFLLDDIDSIVRNPHIRHLWPISEAVSWPLWSQAFTTIIGRPLLSYSIAINYWISGYEVWSYHLFNVLVHIGCACLLYLLVRDAIPQMGSKSPRKLPAAPLAFVASALWVVHPLNSIAVTYIVQRAESMMALFYLLALWLGVRGFASPRSRSWFLGVGLAGACSAACKEVAVTLPVVLLLFDRAFVSGSIRAAFGRHRLLYLLLMLTWVEVAVLLLVAPRAQTFAISTDLTSRWLYLVTQAEVLLHYLALFFWPSALVFHPEWPLATALSPHLGSFLSIAALTAYLLWAAMRRSKAGSVGLCCLLLLAPSSSVVPILTEVAAEHRMYLPSAFLAALCVAGAWSLLDRLRARSWRVAGVGPALAGMLVLASMARTWIRNDDFRSEVSIWRSTVDRQPGNSPAWNNLGEAHLKAGDTRLARECFQQSAALDPLAPIPLNNLGYLALQENRIDEAERFFRQALRIRPGLVLALNNLAQVRLRVGDLAGALDCYQKAVGTAPGDAALRYNLGLTLYRSGRPAEAVRELEGAIRSSADPAAINTCAWILATSRDRAVRNPARALELATRAVSATRTNDASALDTLAAACAANGRFQEAMAAAERAIARANQVGDSDLAKNVSARRTRYASGQALEE